MHFVLQRTAANQLGVFNCLTPFGGVDNVGVLAILDTVLNVRTAFMHLVHQTWVDAGFAQHDGGTVGGIQLKALLQQLRRQVHHALFIAFANGEQRAPLFSHGRAAAQLRLRECFCESAAHAHDFTGGAHFWP
ncbi:hypothetical protein D3C78_1556380 [compost metagenome]